VLTFDEPKHEYKYDGRAIPGVTSIISPLTDYGMIKADVLEKARQEGTHIHKMVELDCLGQTLKLPAWMNPYFAAWKRFIAEVGFELWESEQMVYHPKFRYAGKLDLTGVLTKFKLLGGAMLDIKRSFYAGPAIGVQEAAYEAARNEGVPPERRTRARFGLQLRKDGTYRLQQYEDPDDFSVFLACLTVKRWKEQHGK
jgi:hypothetical protein